MKEEEHAQLFEKFKDSDNERLSTEARLKTMERQMEDQHQKLYMTEINLATEKQTILNLMTELQKAKKATRVAREAAEATVNTSYERGVLDTETRLAEEVAVVCRDYVMESWAVAMDRAGVLANSELRRVESIFFPVEIREIPDTIPPTEQLPPTQTPLIDAKVPKGVRGGEEAQLPVKIKSSKDALTIRDVVSEAKDAELKSQAKGPPSKKANSQKDLPLAKT